MASSARHPSDDKSPCGAVLTAFRSASICATPGQPALVGFSGGIDSSVLLHAAVQVLGPDSVIAVHVHHGLHAQADQWVVHCAAVATQLGVHFDVRHAEPPPARFAGGVENWARDQRRHGLKQAATELGACQVLLAHHADDQIETVLMNLARGTGPDGLVGMRLVRQRDNLVVVRPLLRLRQLTLQAYARSEALHTIEDPSNDDTRLTRNRLRHKVLPGLVEAIPEFDRALLLVAANSADTMMALELSLFGSDGPPEELDRQLLAAADPLIAAQMLRIWLRSRQLRVPGRRRLAHMQAQLVESDAAYAEIRHDGHWVCRYRQQIQVRTGTDMPGRQALNAGAVTLRWDGEPVLALPEFGGSLHFTFVAAGEPGLPAGLLMSEDLIVSGMRMSARLRTRPNGPSKRLKQLCQELGIARWERAALPLLWRAGDLLYAARIGPNAQWQVEGTADEPAVVINWS